MGEAFSIWAGTRYVLAQVPAPPTGPDVTLIDDQTGQVKTIARSGCVPAQPSALEPLDLPWVTFDCAAHAPGLAPVSIGPPAPELYSPASGQWQAVSPSPGLAPGCGDSGCNSYYLEGAGASWLQYDHESCDTGGQHCSPSSVFQSIGTGALRHDPSGGATTVDLNAPNLSQRVCRPLTVPKSIELYAPAPVPGSLTFSGSFALAISGDKSFDSRVYLERCGTHLHRLLTTAPQARPPVVSANTHEVVWMSHPNALSALTFPGLRPFTIRLPKRLVARTCTAEDYSTCVAQIALTNRRMYLLTATSPGQLWTAPNPLPAPANAGQWRARSPGARSEARPRS